MNFLIFRDFSGFFRFYFRFKTFKIIKKNDKKGDDFRAGPTWVRCGTQGHVAQPRGPTLVPTWCGGDTWPIFVFILYSL